MKPDCDLCAAVEALRRGESIADPSSGEILGWKITELPSAMAMLSNDQYYAGYTLVIAKTHATELYQLAGDERRQFCDDMIRVAEAIGAIYQPRKMNYELLGNTIPHLHWHLVPRYASDPTPQRPIWERPHEPKLFSAAEYAKAAEAIRRRLG